MKHKNMQNYLGIIINLQNGTKTLIVYLMQNIRSQKKIKLKKKVP